MLHCTVLRLHDDTVLNGTGVATPPRRPHVQTYYLYCLGTLPTTKRARPPRYKYHDSMIDEAKLLGPITMDHQASSARTSAVPGLTYECRRDLGTFCSTILQNNSMIGSETGNGKKQP